MSKTSKLSSADKNFAYRQRLRAAGAEEILLKLPRETIAMLDDLKQRNGLRSRSEVLLQLIGEKGASTQHVT